MAQIYSQYTKARIGWFLGLTGWQATIVAAATLPFFWSLKEQAWASAAMFLLIAAGWQKALTASTYSSGVSSVVFSWVPMSASVPLCPEEAAVVVVRTERVVVAWSLSPPQPQAKVVTRNRRMRATADCLLRSDISPPS